MKILIVIPAYNEEERIGDTLLVGGKFTLDPGGPDERIGLLGLDAASGTITSWAPRVKAGLASSSCEKSLRT